MNKKLFPPHYRCQALILIFGSRNILDFDMGHYLLILPTCSITGLVALWAKGPDEARKQSWLLSRKPALFALIIRSEAGARNFILFMRLGYSKLHLKYHSPQTNHTNISFNLSNICPALPSSACEFTFNEASYLLIRTFGIELN